jgi:hypothetical protein
VLGDHESRRARIDRGRPIAAPNPIATAMIQRAAAFLAGDSDALVGLAGTLNAAGCRYQSARTLVLAGGEHRRRGHAALEALGLAPMTDRS